jgi:hypothetical protein
MSCGPVRMGTIGGIRELKSVLKLQTSTFDRHASDPQRNRLRVVEN